MNIKITHQWLSEYLKTPATPEEIREYLALCGPSVETVTKAGEDYVYDIEVISNRIDYASVVGIAREAGAIIPRFGKQAKFISKSLPGIKSGSSEYQLEIVDKENLCPRKLAVVMEVKVGKSPQYVTERLENCGIRSLNNLIDVTNYIMLETGHPTHVFDYDRIKTGRIVVRHAKKGESIVTLDKKEYKLDEKDIVFDDGTGRIIDLPGIMGLDNSVVTTDTKRIVFWIETNDSKAIRRTSMRLGIRTVAAAINEKYPDPEAAYTAFMMGIDMFQKNAEGKIMSPLYDTNPKKEELKTIETDYSIFEKIIGMPVTQDEVNKILTNLGFAVSGENGKLIVKVPSYRVHDINIPEDLVEEVARIFGYHNIDSRLQPMVYVEQPKEMENLFVYQNKIKLFLKHLGLNEIINYSMVSKASLEEFGLDPKKHLRLKDSLSTEIEYLRSKIAPSLYKNIKDNTGKKETMSFFELGKVYLKREGELPSEEYMLGLATNTGYRDLKGIIEALLKELNIENELDFKIEEKEEIFYAEIALNDLISSARPFPTYKPINQFAVIKLDKTFELNDSVTYKSIWEKAKKSKLYLMTEFVTVYKNKLTLRFYYSSNDRNITEEEAKKELEKV
ncbi:MAG: phenylalanine--tRNA ligase subunit beta [Patescibacteria group bacterium]